ncbi:hypothetical protein IEQ34_005750 [Dendrobium chrysotoxum]|uniref:Uncharacterized protein n=1 Tax=Dendrobium chrysotoxum TaxID=161865 RepID=A0AAV7HCP9_DENCH|nr:hypothetical protein IEQ34_005750 [Dendrobium chrysotoxum]
MTRLHDPCRVQNSASTVQSSPESRVATVSPVAGRAASRTTSRDCLAGLAGPTPRWQPAAPLSAGPELRYPLAPPAGSPQLASPARLFGFGISETGHGSRVMSGQPGNQSGFLIWLSSCFALCLLVATARPLKEEAQRGEAVEGAAAVNVKLGWNRGPLLLSLLPRGKMPPSGPSGRTHRMNNRN